MVAPLLQTKLYLPRIRPDLVSRPRLIDRLNAGLQYHRLILVSAPAGFGKTTLLSEWAQSLAASHRGMVRTAWLSLDEGDDDLARFLTYLAAGLQTLGIEIDRHTLEDLQSPQPPSAEAFLTALLNQVAAVPARLLLVLDDYHLVSAQPVHEATSFLLDRLPDNLHLAIATRADPPLPIARLRGRGHLLELRQTDLCFSPAEAAAFLRRVLEQEVPTEDIAALTARTEGWAAGLQMAAITMQGQADTADFVRSFAGSNRHVLDYLTEEVLQHQPEPVQAFLLQTSVLDRLCGPLCDAVLRAGHSQATLEYLERANLFIVPLDDQREWYRYHRLFADLLRSHLRRRWPDLVTVLHRRASDWHEQQGDLESAITHALEAADQERAADLIEQVAEATLMSGRVTTLLHWLAALSDETVSTRPSLCVLHAWLLALAQRPLSVVQDRLHDAERYSDQIPGEVAALHALISTLHLQAAEAIAFAHQALAQLPEDNLFLRSAMLWLLSTDVASIGGDSISSPSLDQVARMGLHTGNKLIAVIALGQLAELQARRGHLHAAWDLYQRVLELATDTQGRPLPIAGQILTGLGDLAREWNDLDTAAHYLHAGSALIEQWSATGALECYLYLALVRQAQGDVSEAQQLVHRAQLLAIQFDATDLDDVVVALYQARLWIAQGNLEAAQHWAEERGLYPYTDTSPVLEEEGLPPSARLRKYELIALAELLLAQDQPEQVLRVVQDVLPVAQRRDRPGLIIEAYVLEALARQTLRQAEQALDALARALVLAEHKGYVRLLIDHGEPFHALLIRLQQQRPAVCPAYVSRLLAALAPSRPEQVGEPAAPPREGAATLPPEISPPEHPSTPTLLEPLSVREIEVLRLLPAGLSTEEMAQALTISTHTVRSHLKNIYSKLDVHSRYEAVARAQALHLL